MLNFCNYHIWSCPIYICRIKYEEKRLYSYCTNNQTSIVITNLIKSKYIVSSYIILMLQEENKSIVIKLFVHTLFVKAWITPYLLFVCIHQNVHSAWHPGFYFLWKPWETHDGRFIELTKRCEWYEKRCRALSVWCHIIRIIKRQSN